MIPVTTPTIRKGGSIGSQPGFSGSRRPGVLSKIDPRHENVVTNAQSANAHLLFSNL